ncbi:MSP domain-containing protein [Caenorhabditis elegans]|uniref:MSP domain-containing protein n=1 Tax=Caenorhabditis elegans TaxID=6239 RepID=Q18451_CAEEL|nr:MSP domain-containing protein [Caenorhabditis elegans]CCD66599.1 MSP domain-containing protein [Caenorhabditis elegans]|eukprot:NP_501124.1 Uncharacterized protein CELE_C34D4.3 [Caenorhabditis elegans]
MGVELSLDPPVCPIQANGGVSTHKIINHCDKMLAYKIKSSNNSNYSVNTIFGLIQIGYTADLIITRKPGKPQADKLVIQFAAVEQTCRDGCICQGCICQWTANWRVLWRDDHQAVSC